MEKSNYEITIVKIQDFLSTVEKSTAKSTDTVVTKTLYTLLNTILEESKDTPETIVLSNANLTILEDVVIGKGIQLHGKSMQQMIVRVYTSILLNAPGYSVRNVMSSMLNILGNKSSLISSKECAIAVIGSLMETRSTDCGSMLTDIVQCLHRIIKGSTSLTTSVDTTQRIYALKALISLINGAGSRISDCHLEMIKYAAKYVNDKSSDVRLNVALLVVDIAKQSNAAVSTDILLTLALKGIEDDVAIVQNSFALAVASIFYEQITSHSNSLELARAGNARGSVASEDDKKKKQAPRMSIVKLKELTSISQKKLIEDYDVRSVISHIINQIIKSTGVLKLQSGYFAIFSHLVSTCLRNNDLDNNDLEWLIASTFELITDPLILALTYEEFVYFRTRLSFFLRSSVSANLSENRQLKYAAILTQFISSMEVQTEHEVSLALSELSHIVTVLGEASISIIDDIHSASLIHLRNSSFCVRSAAAYVLSSIALVSPAIAAKYLKDSLLNAQQQVTHLSQYDQNETPSSSPRATLTTSFSNDNMSKIEPSSNNNNDDSSNHGIDSSNHQTTIGSKRKNPKEAERLQRMYYFHGHTLIISILLRNENNLPTGLPKLLVQEVFDFGLELLKQDVLSTPTALRHVTCSIVRAGSLIVSSCLNMGYSISRQRIPSLLQRCYEMLVSYTNNHQNNLTASSSGASNTNSSVNNNPKSDDILYEVMSMEAALVCIATILWSCPETLIEEEGSTELIVDGLETAFRAIKNKFQPKYRSHFRFRTLHAIVLECFAWLPPGSFPNSCQQLFVESLRVFRDSMTAGYECTCLSEYTMFDNDILTIPGQNSIVNLVKLQSILPLQQEIPLNEHMLILKLENHSIALQKKESEAFLASFTTDTSKNMDTDNRISVHSLVEWLPPVAPCSHIDSRTVDAAIILLSSTFGHQDNEYQDKALQLCLQAMTQVAKSSSSLGMFASDEEKRKKEKKNYLAIKNVVAAISGIVKTFSLSLSLSLNQSLGWSQALCDILLGCLTHYNLTIRSCAANSLALFVKKISQSNLLKSVYDNINSSLTSKDRKIEIEDNSGLLIALSSLWINLDNTQDSIKINIMMTMFESLRKIDSSSSFRSQGLLSLTIIVKNMFNNVLLCNIASEYSSTCEIHVHLERVCHIAELHLASIGPSDDIDYLYISLQRLINASVFNLTCILNEIIARSPTLVDDSANFACFNSGNTSPTVIKTDNENSIKSINDILLRFHYMWQLIRTTSSNPSVQCESIKYISKICQNIQYSKFIIKDVLLIIQNELIIKDNNNHFKSIQAALECIQMFIPQVPDLVCSLDIDITLFTLYDWCLSSNSVSVNTAYTGLELRCGSSLNCIIGDINTLQENIENSIICLAKNNVYGKVNNADLYLCRWILLCRAIALGVRTRGFIEESDNDNNDGEEGDNEDGESNNSSNPTSSSNNNQNTPMTYQQFASRCRDEVIQRTSSLTSTRIKVKCISIKCSYLLLKEYSDTSSPHFNLEIARRKTQESLRNISNVNNEEFYNIPCYLSLFIHDIVNMGCACSTYTIEDKKIVELQTESILFLQIVIDLFWTCLDPDIITGISSDQGDNVISNRIIQQFMSQLISSVRQGMLVKWCPLLLQASGTIICDLIRGGLLTDIIVIKKIVKNLLATNESNNKSDSNQSVSILSSEVSETISTLDYIINSSLLSQLYLLTSNNITNNKIDLVIKTTIISLMKSYLRSLKNMWCSIAIDTARLLQNDDVVSIDNTTINNFYWSNKTIESDQRRGGITYNYYTNLSIVIPYYIISLPYVLASSSIASLSAPPLNFSTMCLFSISMSALEEEFKLNKISKRLSYYLRSFVSLADISSIQDANNTSNNTNDEGEDDNITIFSNSVIPTKEWTRLLKFIINLLPFHIATNEDAVDEFNIFLSDVIDIIINLQRYYCDYFSNDKGSEKDVKSLFKYMWMLLLSILQTSCSCLFSENSITNNKLIIANKLPELLFVPKSINKSGFNVLLIEDKIIDKDNNTTCILLKLIKLLTVISKQCGILHIDYACQLLVSLVSFSSLHISDFSENNNIIVDRSVIQGSIVTNITLLLNYTLVDFDLYNIIGTSFLSWYQFISKSNEINDNRCNTIVDSIVSLWHSLSLFTSSVSIIISFEYF
jgi:hypothetical protein